MSKRSRKSSSFHMLGATPAKVTKLRVQATFEDYELIPTSPALGAVDERRESRSPTKNRSRIYSDIDGTPPGRDNLNSSINQTPTRIRNRGGSFV